MNRDGIGGSDAAAVCGLVPWRRPVDVWLEKTGKVPPRKESEAMYWGTMLEPLVVFEVERKTEYTAIDPPEDGYALEGFMFGHPDRLLAKNGDGHGILEVKTTSSYRAREWEDDEVPPDAYLQLQHYFALSGLDWGIAAVLIGGQRFEWRRVERDDDLIGLMLDRERAFWKAVQDNVPPPDWADGSPATDKMIGLLYPEADAGKRVNLTAEHAEWVEKYRNLKRAEKATKEQATEFEQRLKMALGEAEVGLHQGQVLVRWPTIERKGYEVKPSTYRRFSVA